MCQTPRENVLHLATCCLQVTFRLARRSISLLQWFLNRQTFLAHSIRCLIWFPFTFLGSSRITPALSTVLALLAGGVLGAVGSISAERWQPQLRAVITICWIISYRSTKLPYQPTKRRFSCAHDPMWVLQKWLFMVSFIHLFFPEASALIVS